MLGLVAAGSLLLALPGGANATLMQVGSYGQGAFVVAAALFCSVGLPRQVVAYAAAFAFGLSAGLALSLIAQVLSCALDVIWARALGRRWAQRFMERRLGGRLARLDTFLAAHPFSATLMLRLLPVGNNLVLNLLAGVSGVALLPFVAASALGYVPQTLVFALLGSGTRVEQTAQVALAVALFLVSVLFGVLLLRRIRLQAPV